MGTGLPNLVRGDTTDGQVQHLARCNHAYDRLASYEVTLVRQRELVFYTAHQHQAATMFYFSGSGLPFLGDPYEQITCCCFITAEKGGVASKGVG